MSGFLNRVNLMISRYLSNRLLMREQLMLLSIMACMVAVSSMSSVFINLFLFDLAGTGINGADGIAVVVRYNLIVGVVSFFSCFLMGIVAKKLTYKLSMMIGIVFHLTLYAVAIVAGKNLLNYIFIVSLLAGLGATFFYLSYYSLMNVVITGLAKKQYVMFQGIISVGFGIILPLLSAGLIAVCKGTIGFTVVFWLCLFVCVAAVLLTVKMEKIRGQSRQTYFANVFIKSLVNKKYFAVSICDVLRGLKEGTVSFFIPVMLYQLSDNIFVVGVYFSLCTMFGILGNILMQKFNITRHPISLMFVSIFFQFAALCVMIFKINILTIFLFGIICAIFAPMHITPLFMTYYNALESMGNSIYKRNLESACVKEIYFNLGRVVSIMIMMSTMRNTIVTIGVLAVFFAIQVIGCVISASIRPQRDGGEQDVD